MRIAYARGVAVAVLAVCLLSAPAGAANDRPLIYGMNPIPAEWARHNGDQSWWEPQEYEKMKAAGCAAVRAGLGWDLVEPTPGERNWGEIDNDLKLMMDRGFEPVLIVVATPSWALLPGQSPPFYPPQPQFRPEFEKFYYDVARKFRGRVRYYEFWNEENGYGWHTDEGYQKAEEYVPWLIHGYNAIRKGDPNALWSIGGLDDNGIGYGDDYLRKCYYYMSKGYFDAVCEHPYSAESAQLWKLDDLRSVMQEYTDDVPIWITEMGWTANGRETQVAAWIDDYLTRLSGDAYGFCKIATYHTSTDFTSEPYGYGLMTYDLLTKPTYTSFQQVAKPTRACILGVPRVTRLGPAKLQIDFSTDRPATTQVMYGLTIGYGMVTARETVESTSHSFIIDGLLPGTYYHYRIRTGSGEYADSFSLDYTTSTLSGPVVGLMGEATVSSVTTDSATVSWSTSVAADAKVEYGTGYDYSHSASDSTVSASHSITLTGLDAHTVYQARIVSTSSGYGNLVREIDPIVTKRTPGVLGNGGFESYGPRQPWIIYGRNDGRATGTWYASFTARTGDALFGSAASWDNKSGGCYQEVGAVPGGLYRVSAWTKSYQVGGTLGEDAARVGIDPTGGTDPYAATIIWGPWVYNQIEWEQMDCSAVAQSDQITVYIDIRQPAPQQWNVNAVDDVELQSFSDQYAPLSQVKSAPPGTPVAATGAVCTANFGDHIYVQAANRVNALRINAVCEAQPGDVVAFGGTASFAGPEKSVDADAVGVVSQGSAVEPVVLLASGIGGKPLPGQVEMLPNQSGINTLNMLVKVCGRVAASEPGYFYVDDCSGAADLSGHAGIRVVLPEEVSGPAPDSVVSAWGIAAAQQIGGQWAPVVKLVDTGDYVVHQP